MSAPNTKTMKNIIVLFILAFSFVGCNDEIKFNMPSFQGERNGNLWEASSYFASVDANGVVTITATDGIETIILKAFPDDGFVCVGNNTSVFSKEQGNCFTINSTTNNSFATLLDLDNTLWSTNNVPDSSVQIHPADGEINIREINLDAGVISGRFYFTAFNSLGLSSINVSQGFFYNVPITF